MSNSDIERATTSTADMVAAGLENHARAITARVIQLLAEDRKSILGNVEDLGTMIGAVASQVAELSRHHIETTAGIHGLALQLARYEALVSPDERKAARAQMADHERRISALEARYGNGE